MSSNESWMMFRWFPHKAPSQSSADASPGHDSSDTHWTKLRIFPLHPIAMFQYWMAIKSTKKLNQPSKHQSQGTHHVAASYRTVRSFVLRENAIHMIQYTRLIDAFQFFDSWLTFPLGHDATQLAMIIKSENAKYIEIPNPIIEILADVSFIESPMFTPALSHPWTHASSKWRAGRHDRLGVQWGQGSRYWNATLLS